MLISLSKKFIFIANLKTASTSIEAVLAPLCEISLQEASHGKHWPYRTVERRFQWIFEIVKRKDFFVFGVMRDPVDYILSLYNSHAGSKFEKRPHLYTGNMDFDEFLSGWTEANAGQVIPQYQRFLTGNGKIGPDYIISFDKLREGLERVSKRVGAPQLRGLEFRNVSNARVMMRSNLSQSQIDWIEERYAQDRNFMKFFCDVEIVPDAISWTSPED